MLRALRRVPTERYPTLAALKADLDNVSDVRFSGLAEYLVPVTSWRRTAAWARYLGVVGALPIAVLVVTFRALWWYLERTH